MAGSSSTKPVQVTIVATLALLMSTSLGFTQDRQTPRNTSTSQALPLLPSQFLADPDKLLTQYPDGGSAMISEVRELVVSDITTLDRIMALVPKMTDAQKSALGTGLGQAALILSQKRPEDMNAVQQAIAQLADKGVTQAFTEVTGDVAIGAGGGGGGGGGGESQTAPFPIPLITTTAGDSGTTTSAIRISPTGISLFSATTFAASSGLSGPGGSNGSNGSITNLGKSVSPTRP